MHHTDSHCSNVGFTNWSYHREGSVTVVKPRYKNSYGFQMEYL